MRCAFRVTTASFAPLGTTTRSRASSSASSCRAARCSARWQRSERTGRQAVAAGPTVISSFLLFGPVLLLFDDQRGFADRSLRARVVVAVERRARACDYRGVGAAL